MSRQKGISDEHLLAVVQFRASSLFTAAEKTAMEYAEEMCRQPVAVSDELFARLREHFSDRQILELSASIAYENYRARFYHALGVESDGLYVCPRPPAKSG